VAALLPRGGLATRHECRDVQRTVRNGDTFRLLERLKIHCEKYQWSKKGHGRWRRDRVKPFQESNFSRLAGAIVSLLVSHGPQGVNTITLANWAYPGEGKKHPQWHLDNVRRCCRDQLGLKTIGRSERGNHALIWAWPDEV
jgi:hypothetical protein